MDAPRPTGVLGTAPPLLSIFLQDCNIHVTTNTFVRFMEGANEFVGMVVGIKVAERAFTVRRFLSLEQLRIIVGNMRNDVSFWPREGSATLSFLCDSDIVVEVGHSEVVGLAFVFYISDPLVRQVRGMANAYAVSSFFVSHTMTLWHCQSFSSFPSTSPHRILSTCFPSTIMQQLIAMKTKMQQLLNTRSKNARNRVFFQFDNFSVSTWNYMKGLMVVDVELAQVIVKRTFILGDESVVEKWRTTQEQVHFTLPEHLDCAQKIFGTSAGLGVRVFLPCPMGRSNHFTRGER